MNKKIYTHTHQDSLIDTFLCVCETQCEQLQLQLYCESVLCVYAMHCCICPWKYSFWLPDTKLRHQTIATKI